MSGSNKDKYTYHQKLYLYQNPTEKIRVKDLGGDEVATKRRRSIEDIEASKAINEEFDYLENEYD